MAKTSYSGEIVRNKKAILKITGTEIAEAVVGCGSTTGRNTDKAENVSHSQKSRAVQLKSQFTAVWQFGVV